MSTSLKSVAHLLIGIAVLEVGSGLQGVLLPIRAEDEGFSLQAIGLLGTGYYAGFVFGCTAIPGIMRRIGHIRSFSGWAALAAAAFLVHPLLVSIPVWLVLRAIVGFCFAGLYMAVESWLNARASMETRGELMATYTVITWIAVTAGKLLFSATDPAGFLPFALVAITICLAMAPIAFTYQAAPAVAPEARFRFVQLVRLTPVAAFGCLGVGAANGAFWSLAPIYGAASGLSTSEIGFFMSAAVVGGALAQWPLGKLSDRVDRRIVIAASALAAAAAGAAMVLEEGATGPLLMALAFGFGICALPLYALCVAHANDQIPNENLVEVSGELLTMFGIGAVAGPYLASLAAAAAGHAGLFIFTAVIHLALATYAVWRIARREATNAAAKNAFVVEPSTQATTPSAPRPPTAAEEVRQTQAPGP